MPRSPIPAIVETRATGYSARYRAEHCGIEIYVTVEGVPSQVPPEVILASDSHTCMACHAPVTLELLAAATKLPAIVLD